MFASIRSATKLAKPSFAAVRAGSRRNFSAESHAEHEATLEFWKKAAIAGVGVCVSCSVYLYLFDEHAHEHHPHFTYLKFRSKAFPWGECKKCDYFDYECWGACRSAAKK